MPVEVLLQRVLYILGIGFLVANLRIVLDFIRFQRLRRTARLTWPGRKPPFYGLLLGLGVTLGLLLFYKLIIQQRPVVQTFGEGMMFFYYAYLLPLSLRIGRGFYEEGIWAERGFMPYSQIGGLAWREEKELTLVLVARGRPVARRLVVPQANYGAARRLLRDKIAQHDIQLTTARLDLDLGSRDERDAV